MGISCGDPHVGDDGTLGAGSFAIGAGSSGQDMGAKVPAGATISGLPAGTTTHQDATARVGGAAITHYRYRLDDGGFSQELTIDTPIRLNGLTNGPHVLLVVGKNELGIWQDESSATTAAWTVESNLRPSIIISEILADNRSVDVNGFSPDLIELYNPSQTPLDLSGFSISDDADVPDRYVFSPKYCDRCARVSYLDRGYR